MKKNFLLIFLTLSAISFGQRSELKICDCKELVMKGKDGKSAFKNKMAYTGKCQTKNSNGIVSKELNYYNGQLQGESKEYYLNGDLKEITEYSRNMKHGKYILYNENGQIIIEGNYKNKLKEGKWKYYDKDSGKLTKTTDFKFGKEKNSR
ncbi:hypothetical protein QVZ41_14515 [Wenyingzhuangia sp. chi5]|uniref:Toxin-antitoxin system YwqK family antitoxin n=1 Tax=Wenyingzhuangia gilva TaxID=3057677 RepID=A0ABT8VVQ8_9FLAO|nr:hypothetical protein [Wenyingzhuangia sp. chi5]MDO3696063.1 hypothetical protein [Wenyingzhuangia sp. chi5]